MNLIGFQEIFLALQNEPSFVLCHCLLVIFNDLTVVFYPGYNKLKLCSGSLNKIAGFRKITVKAEPKKTLQIFAVHI